MHSDRDWKPRDKHGCTDKVKHRSRSSAEQEANRLTITLGKKMHAYKCTYCRFNTFHVGTVMDIEIVEKPVLIEEFKKEKSMLAPKPNNPFQALKSLADKVEQPKWSEKPKVVLPEKYPISELGAEILRKMEEYTAGKFPAPLSKNGSFLEYKKHYSLSASIGTAMNAMGYFDECPAVGRFKVIHPDFFHAQLVRFLEDTYDQAVDYRTKKEKEKKARAEKLSAAHKAAKIVSKSNQQVIVSKLKDVAKAINELVGLIEGSQGA